MRNGAKAVEHARRACDLDGRKEWAYLVTLAVAHAQAGQFDDAQTQLQAALAKMPADQQAQYRPLEEKFKARQSY